MSKDCQMSKDQQHLSRRRQKEISQKLGSNANNHSIKVYCADVFIRQSGSKAVLKVSAGHLHSHGLVTETLTYDTVSHFLSALPTYHKKNVKEQSNPKGGQIGITQSYADIRRVYTGAEH